MNLIARIRAIQSPEPKEEGYAVIKVVLEAARKGTDINELLDLRDGGAVVVYMFPKSEQKLLPFSAPAVVIGPDEVNKDEANRGEADQDEAAQSGEEATQETLFDSAEGGQPVEAEDKPMEELR